MIAGMPYKFSDGAFLANINKIEPDIVFTLSDWWTTTYIGKTERKNDWAWIQWLPIDGEPYDSSTKWTDSFLTADVIIGLAKYGYNQLKEGKEYAMEKSTSLVFPELTWIYHCVDTDIFKPLPYEIRKKTREKYEIPESAVVYLCVARNQPRKNYPVLFKAWADFIAKYKLTEDDAVLWVHALQQDAGWNLRFLVDQIALNKNRKKLNGEEFKKTIKFTPDLQTLNDSVSPNELAKIYNMANWFILPTSGEGFGVPTIEAMACGTPPIITDCTTSGELLDYGNNGILVKYDFVDTFKGNVDRFVISRKGLVKTLKETYFDVKRNNSKLQKIYSKNGREWAVENVDTKVIVHHMDELLRNFWHDWKNKATEREKLKKKEKKFGDEFDKQYMETQKNNRIQGFAKIERKSFLGLIPKDIFTVLDVGCGSGEDLRHFNREGLFTVGCDVSEAALTYCRDRGFTVEYADVERLDEFYKKDEFEATWCSHVLEHIENWKNALDKLWHISERIIGLCIPYDNMRDASHVRCYKEEEIEEIKQYYLEKGAKEVITQPCNDSFFHPVSYLVIALK